MYVSASTQAKPSLCLVAPGSECEKQAIPDEKIVSSAAGVFLVAENGFRTKIHLDWGI